KHSGTAESPAGVCCDDIGIQRREESPGDDAQQAQDRRQGSESAEAEESSGLGSDDDRLRRQDHHDGRRSSHAEAPSRFAAVIKFSVSAGKPAEVESAGFSFYGS